MNAYKITCSDGEKYIIESGSVMSALRNFHRTNESIENTKNKVSVMSVEETVYKIPTNQRHYE